MSVPTTSRVMVHLEIYNDCELGATAYSGDYDEVIFTFSGPFDEDANIMFERGALERFVSFAHEALKLRVVPEVPTTKRKLISLPPQKPNHRLPTGDPQ